MPKKVFPPVQQMSQHDFLRAAKATPLSKNSLNYEVWLGDRFIGYERGNTPIQAAERAHERSVMDAIAVNMPNAAPWEKRPAPSAMAVHEYPHLQNRYGTMLASKSEAIC